ncbi:TolC family protein [endosymbiont of unidentified scaly snail isolate Monju]|uniref:TolC family protein n=1 Tax=endosymbiont of unidentified scaly snail isolate Monju TaxID=1248727 RepID=UPI0003892655|nr:TolC family protein [endosymbiont of unidentified scaly snail isolate Monju]BAN68368.1 RND superfamily heavy metal efflux transporter OMF subunit [endosymbiont of unidentified scaly snail isolate Monju]
MRSLSLAACVAPAMATGTELPLPDGLRALVRSAVADHPEVRAAQARVRAAEARRDGAARPLYNPELQLDAQRTSTGSNSLEAGLSQALDWHGKQAARTVGSEHELALARAGLVTVRARLAGELLAALRRCEEERAQRDLVQAQHDLLARFTRLTERRARAGGVPPAAVRLARLAVRQMALELASSEAAAGVQVLGAGGCPEPGLFPALPPDLPKALAEGLDERHPELQELAVAVTAAQAQIRQADTERRADPSLGLRLGRDAGENLVGLSFALPLQVRNDYRETVRAARAAHAEALAGLAAARQRLEATLDGSVRRLHRLHRAWEEWMAGSGASGSFDRDGELERLWRAGELDTGDYLQQLQQALDTRAAAESLRAALWTAWLDTWAASGLLSRWIEEE